MGFSRQEHWSGLLFPSPIHESEVAQLCPTLSKPMDCSLPGSSIHGIFQARILEWGAIAFSEEVGLALKKGKREAVLQRNCLRMQSISKRLNQNKCSSPPLKMAHWRASSSSPPCSRALAVLVAERNNLGKAWPLRERSEEPREEGAQRPSVSCAPSRGCS